MNCGAQEYERKGLTALLIALISIVSLHHLLNIVSKKLLWLKLHLLLLNFHPQNLQETEIQGH